MCWRSLLWHSADISPGRCPWRQSSSSAAFRLFSFYNQCSQRDSRVASQHSQRSYFWTSPSQSPLLIMPNQQKKVIFCMAGVLSFVCALGVVTALGTPLWIKATFLCKTGALLVNASGQELDKFMGEMQYGLFHGEGVRQCGLGARPFRFSCK